MSPDTIIPSASQGNGAFDRYAYVNNNPINLYDPSGNFTVNAVWEYIQSNYPKNQWAQIFTSWFADTAWWTILMKAEAGDRLDRVWYDQNGNPHHMSYQFDGVGKVKLFGLKGDLNSEDFLDSSTPDLNFIHVSSNGLGCVRYHWFYFVFEVIGQTGDLKYINHKVSEQEANSYGSYISVAEMMIGGLGETIGFLSSFFGIGLNFIPSYLGSNMGFKENDVILSVETTKLTGYDEGVQETITYGWTETYRLLSLGLGNQSVIRSQSKSKVVKENFHRRN